MGTEDTDTGLLAVEIEFPGHARAQEMLESLGFRTISGSSSLMEYDDFFKSSTGITARFFSNTDETVRIRLHTHEPSNEHDREKIRKAVVILSRPILQTLKP